MNSFTKIAVCAMAFAGLSIASAETVNLADKTFLKKSFGDFSATGKEFTTKGMTYLFGSKSFDVDPAKKISFKLTVSGKLEKNARVYVGFNLMDAKGRGYQAIAWQGITTSFTQLTRAAKKGDTVIYVKNGGAWSTASTVYIALNAKEDGSDLPNTKIAMNNIKTKVKKGDEWEMTLKTPLKVDIAAGTNVRQHIAGGYYYCAIKDIKPTDKEVVLTGAVQGFAKTVGGFNGKNWPIGVKKVNFLIWADWGKTGAVLNFKDASLVVE